MIEESTDIKGPILDNKERSYATGKRKNSIARVWLKKGEGKISINGKSLKDYFSRPVLQMIVNQPLEIIQSVGNYDIKATVKGGGLSGQAGAIIHGLARAILQFEPELKPTLKKEKLTTRDSRAVERKKYGRKKARRSFQFSKR